MSHRSFQTLFLGVLSAIAVFAALRIGQGLFAPMLAALVLGIVCAPLTDWVERWGLPRILAALFVLILLVVSTSTLFVFLEPTITRAVQNAPTIWREMTQTLDALRGTFAGVQDLQETVAQALNDGDAAGAPDSEEAVTIPGVMDALALAPSFAAALLIFAGTFYFFLISRRELYQTIDRGPIPVSDTMLCRAEARVSRYFLTITVINASFGTLVGLVMTVVGLPQPLIWGLAAFLINFVLYLGPAVLAVTLLIAGIVTFNGAMSFVPMVLYVSMNMTEGQFVTPALVGQQMKVNPLLVFMSLVFWLWLWGPIGGVVAIPVLVWWLYILGHLDWDEPATRAAPV